MSLSLIVFLAFAGLIVVGFLLALYVLFRMVIRDEFNGWFILGECAGQGMITAGIVHFGEQSPVVALSLPALILLFITIYHASEY